MHVSYYVYYEFLLILVFSFLYWFDISLEQETIK